MATTTNYSWTTPDDTALVKDGASAIRTLGSSVDTTTKNLNPETTLGDISFRSSTSNTNTRVGIGSSGQALTVVAGVPSWAASSTSTLTTTGDTLYASAANTLARRAIGSTGDVLTVSGGIPTWAAPAAGGMTLISTTSLTGASVTLSSIPATYKNLQLIVRNYYAVNDGNRLNFRFNADATSNRHVSLSTISGTGSFNGTATNATNGQDNAASQGLTVIDVFDYANTTTWKFFRSSSIANDQTSATDVAFFTAALGAYNQTGAISSIELFPSSSNFTAGSVLLYGVK